MLISILNNSRNILNKREFDDRKFIKFKRKINILFFDLLNEVEMK